MKLINADEFLWKLEDYAITDADRDFCRKVKFALDKETPVEAIPIEFLDTLAKKQTGNDFGGNQPDQGQMGKRKGKGWTSRE